jgi:hypothetical protein
MLTADKAFPGIRHFDTPRAYLLEREDGAKCVVKPFPECYRNSSGLDHMGTQELLHAALQKTPGYTAARVFGHIALSTKHSAGFALVEYMDAYTYRQIEGPVNHTNFLTRTVTRATVFLSHRNKRHKMLHPHTKLTQYLGLCAGVRNTVTEALSDFGVYIPPKIEQGRYQGCSNWDFNPDNLLCGVDGQGLPELAIIDQGCDLSSLVRPSRDAA